MFDMPNFLQRWRVIFVFMTSVIENELKNCIKPLFFRIISSNMHFESILCHPPAEIYLKNGPFRYIFRSIWRKFSRKFFWFTIPFPNEVEKFFKTMKRKVYGIRLVFEIMQVKKPVRNWQTANLQIRVNQGR